MQAQVEVVKDEDEPDYIPSAPHSHYEAPREGQGISDRRRTTFSGRALSITRNYSLTPHLSQQYTPLPQFEPPPPPDPSDSSNNSDFSIGGGSGPRQGQDGNSSRDSKPIGQQSQSSSHQDKPPHMNKLKYNNRTTPFGVIPPDNDRLPCQEFFNYQVHSYDQEASLRDRVFLTFSDHIDFRLHTSVGNLHDAKT
uniref:Uncharacterized protein n=1 Tax=Moniliophthora roreri TaxID=221103 RepID=A0A0W0FWP3_MONRR